MNKTKTPNWQPLTMVPVLVEMTRDMLEASKGQLSNMEQAIKKPHALDDETVQRILKLHTGQNEFVPVYLEQCHRWRKETLNAKQQEWVGEIESNIKELETTNQEILSAANSCKAHTIDKIMEKDGAGLALDVLSGKLDN